MSRMLARVGGKAGEFEGFTRTWRNMSALNMEDELKQVCLYRMIPLAFTPRRALSNSLSSVAFIVDHVRYHPR